MSAPDTDLEKQTRRHRGPMVGITFGLALAALLALAAFVWPGIPLDEQAAADGAPAQATDEDAVSDGLSITTDNEANTNSEETQ